MKKYKRKTIGNGRWYLGDCFDVFKDIPDNSIDMILCDPPYGTTRNSWDSILPFPDMWKEYNRVISPSGTIAIFSHQSFTARTILSNERLFKYRLNWVKYKATNFLNAKKQPLRRVEDICIFYNKNIYNPQMVPGEPYDKGVIRNVSTNYNSAKPSRRKNESGDRYPTDVVEIKENINYITIHPTQKPATLFEYLIKTYTHKGMTVLDNCAGSGTTAIAAENTKRKWICIEKDRDYSIKAIQRIREHLDEGRKER